MKVIISNMIYALKTIGKTRQVYFLFPKYPSQKGTDGRAFYRHMDFNWDI